ncbi:MAG: hypothetical protein ABR584_04390 [Candidatus Baltobacteraceae bacterium]
MAGRKIFIRYGQDADAARLISEGLVGGKPPPNETWEKRIGTWFSEQKAGRRLILVAEDGSGILGLVQIVFSFPVGYNDPEAANGRDIAMMEGLRIKPGAPAEVGNELVHEVQGIARKKNVKTLTFCLPMNQNKALAQAKRWGFEEFRIMAEKTKMLCFFRKNVD